MSEWMSECVCVIRVASSSSSSSSSAASHSIAGSISRFSVPCQRVNGVCVSSLRCTLYVLAGAGAGGKWSVSAMRMCVREVGC